tara:strand:- start:19822 stop:20013 length:192 start_codon:yes stop_codon:yes gene_type:complete
MKAFVEVIGKSPKLREIVADHGKYFELVMQRDVAGSPHVTVKDENIQFTTSVKNIRIIYPEES